jgi:biotin transporter BioY
MRREFKVSIVPIISGGAGGSSVSGFSVVISPSVSSVIVFILSSWSQDVVKRKKGKNNRRIIFLIFMSLFGQMYLKLYKSSIT